MARIDYSAVTNANSTFNQPRQKMWVVLQQAPFWTLKIITPSFTEAQSKVKEILSGGGIYASIDKIILCEIVPIDFAMTPNV